METFDTNVLVRVVYQDEPSQVERARRAWQAAVNGGGAFLTITVLVELACVPAVVQRFFPTQLISIFLTK